MAHIKPQGSRRPTTLAADIRHPEPLTAAPLSSRSVSLSLSSHLPTHKLKCVCVCVRACVHVCVRACVHTSRMFVRFVSA